MKRFRAEYSENRIAYWPTYEAGKIAKIFIVLVGAVFIATSILVLLDNSSRITQVEIMVALPLVIVSFLCAFIYISRIMYTKIVVSAEGIVSYKSNGVIEKQISWGEVSAVYFSQDHWYGRTSCWIYLDKAHESMYEEKDKCDFVLPVSFVDEEKLLQVIPNHLWKNRPQWL